MSSPSAPGPQEPYRPYYGSGYAGDDFRGIGGHLLREFPRVTQPPAGSPLLMATHGPHLVARMMPGADGARVAACPVCVTQAAVPAAAGGWVPLRCTACGTEFHASDGTPPPSPPPPPVAAPRPVSVLESVLAELERRSPTPSPVPPVPPAFPAERIRWNLGRWVASGEPDRWVEYRKGLWGEADFRALVQLLKLSPYWPLEVREVRRVLHEATTRYWAKTPPAPPPPARPRKRKSLPLPAEPPSMPGTLGAWIALLLIVGPLLLAALIDWFRR